MGKNLQDHYGVYLAPFFIRPGLGAFFDRDLTPAEFVKWFTLGTGRLTNTGCEASGAVASHLAKERGEGDWPDLHLISYSFTNFRLGAEQLSRVFHLKQDELAQYIGGDIGRDSLYIAISGARPFSVRFNSYLDINLN